MRAIVPKMTQSSTDNLVLDHLVSHEYDIVGSLLVLSPKLHENLFDHVSFSFLFVHLPSIEHLVAIKKVHK